MSHRSLACGAALVVVAACNSPLAPREQAERSLVRHEAQWRAAAIHDYAFDYDLIAMARNPEVRIEVRGDTVAGVEDLATGASLPRAGWPTIDSVFAAARSALARPDDRVTVTYDESRGYPTRVDVSTDVPDTGFSIVVGGWVARR